jgi:hypothetical protein
VRINIQIERLVFDGIDLQRGQRPLIQAAFERELARLLVRDGLNHDLSSGVALPSLNVQTIQLPNGNRPDAFGQQIAQAVYKGIGIMSVESTSEIPPSVTTPEKLRASGIKMNQ